MVDSFDSQPCDACALAAGVGALAAVDDACQLPDMEVHDPYDIAVKSEVVLEPEWASPYASWGSPLVVDLDGDGTSEIAINDCELNVEACLFTVFNADGAVRWSRMGVNNWSPFAAVDLDRSAGAELLTGDCPDFTECEHPDLVALSGDGVFLWRFDGEWDRNSGFDVVDLEGDGHPEILNGGMILDAQTGMQRGSYDVRYSGGRSIAVADIDHDGLLEFAQSGALFASDGSMLWAVPARWPGGMAIALQADADPEPEFLFGDEGFILVDTDGTVLSQLDETAFDSESVVLADFDGDRLPELALATRSTKATVAVYRLDGSLMWEHADIGYVEPMVGWDMDGDGAAELIVQTGWTSEADGALKVLSGATGDVLFSTPNLHHSDSPPIVADMDGDGHAELLVCGGAPHADDWIPSVTIYHQVNDTWPAAGPAWPVPNYHLTNIGPAGEVPIGEPDPAPWTYNLFHARPAVDGQPANLTPTLVQTCSDTCEEGGSVQIEVRVTNSGPEDANEVLLRVTAGGTTVTETTLPLVGSGVMSAGVLLTIPGTTFDLGEVRVVVDPNGANAECEEGDNEVVVADPR